MINDKSFTVDLCPRITYENLEGELVTEFEDSEVLALLLAKGVLFINNHWWEEEFTEEQRRLFSINLNVNDCFYCGSDAEEVLYDELEDLYNHYEKDPERGIIVWCAKKRKQLPLPKVCDWITATGEWDLENIV